MKNIIDKVAVLGFLAVLVIACNSKKNEKVSEVPVVDKEQIKTEIQAAENEFVEAYNNRNVDNITFYAEDAVSFLQGGSPLNGRTGIIESLKKDMESAPKGNKFTFTTKEVLPSNDGNLVVEIGAFILKDSANMVINSGNYMSVFEKRDGKYVCIRDMGASDKPNKDK